MKSENEKERIKRELEESNVPNVMGKSLCIFFFIMFMVCGIYAIMEINSDNLATPISWFISGLFFIGAVRTLKFWQ